MCQVVSSPWTAPCAVPETRQRRIQGRGRVRVAIGGFALSPTGRGVTQRHLSRCNGRFRRRLRGLAAFRRLGSGATFAAADPAGPCSRSGSAPDRGRLSGERVAATPPLLGLWRDDDSKKGRDASIAARQGYDQEKLGRLADVGSRRAGIIRGAAVAAQPQPGAVVPHELAQIPKFRTPPHCGTGPGALE